MLPQIMLPKILLNAKPPSLCRFLFFSSANQNFTRDSTGDIKHADKVGLTQINDNKYSPHPQDRRGIEQDSHDTEQDFHGTEQDRRGNIKN